MKKTVSVVIILLFAAFAGFLYLGSIFSDKFVSEKLEKIINSKNTGTDTLKSDLEGYPFSLRRYLDNTIKKDFIKPSFVRLKQSGDMKTNENSSSVSFEANQYYNTIVPGYIWDGKLKTNDFIWTRVIESFENGKANILVKFLSSLTLSDNQANELDQSALARYLTEAVFFPALLYPSGIINWERIDNNVAEATLQYQHTSVKAKFYFNEANEIYKVTTTDKFRASEAGYKNVPSSILYSEYRWFGDFKAPTKYTLQWIENGESVTFGNFEIRDIEYDVKELY